MACAEKMLEIVKRDGFVRCVACGGKVREGGMFEILSEGGEDEKEPEPEEEEKEMEMEKEMEKEKEEKEKEKEKEQEPELAKEEPEKEQDNEAAKGVGNDEAMEVEEVAEVGT